MYDINDKSKQRLCKNFIQKHNISKYDTIMSIGAGSGKFEFLIACFTDSITFYLEDLDTTCITKNKINNEYLPHYAKIKGKPLSCNFIAVKGTEKSVDFTSNKIDKVIIYNVFHHFDYDNEMLEEAYRLLKPCGKLIICEHVLKRNRDSWKFCSAGGHYKTEDNFITDVVSKGFDVDTVYNYKSKKIAWREFVFSKL